MSWQTFIAIAAICAVSALAAWLSTDDMPDRTDGDKARVRNRGFAALALWIVASITFVTAIAILTT